MMRTSYLVLSIVLCAFLFLGSARRPSTGGDPLKATKAHSALFAPRVLGANSTSFTDVAGNLLGSAATVARPLLSAPFRAHQGAESATAEECANCHEDEVASFDMSTHAQTMPTDALACESCHGDATLHLQSAKEHPMRSMTKVSPAEANETCLTCHEQTGSQSHMRRSEHSLAGVACIECHDVHPDADEKAVRTSSGHSAMMRAPEKELCTSCHETVGAEFSLPTHHRMHEGAMDCSSCHNPHGTVEQKQLLANNKDNCLKCHEDKRGPFAFEHGATALEGCLGCHQPHGSSGPKLLKAKDARTLCVSCHARGTAAGVPHTRLGLQATGDCSRCHSEIHGSNSDPFFTH